MRLTIYAATLFFWQNVFAQLPQYHVKYTSQSPKGYYFLHACDIWQEKAPWKPGYQMILDEKGQTVYYRRMDRCFDFKLQENGLISYFAPNKFYLADSNFRTIGSVSCIKKNVLTDLHDFRISTNGHYLLIGVETNTMDLSCFPLFLNRKIPGSKVAKVTTGVIQELDKNRQLVFEWHSKDHFKFDDIDPFYLTDTANVDWTHFNSIEEDYDGNWIVSIKNFNSLVKIRKNDGAVLWVMGGKSNQFKGGVSGDNFLGQHFVRKTEKNRMIVFDNGHADSLRKHASRALEYKVDEKTKTASVVWSYTHRPFLYSSGKGNAQRLDNNYTLLNYGNAPNNRLTFEVVNNKGKQVFNLSFTDSLLGSYRVMHYSKLPWKLKRPVLKYYKEGENYYLEVPVTGPVTWSTGETSQRIKINENGAYYAYLPYGDGGYISSEIFMVSGPELPDKKTR